jgi:hypothetical protein
VRSFLDAAAARLARFPREEIAQTDYHVRAEKAFFERNKLLYVDTADLVDFRDRLKRKISEEREKHDPLSLGLEGPARSTPATELDPDALKRKYKDKLRPFEHLPDGYYIGEDGRFGALIARVPPESSGVAAGRPLLARVASEMEALRRQAFPSDVRLSFGGTLQTYLEEHDSTRDDLILASSLCVGLVLLSILLFYRRLRAIPLLGLPLLMGVAWTMGVTRLAIGYLNMSTSFLVAIVAGNGVNFGIILLARYFEERRLGRGPSESLPVAVHTTLRATAVAALCAAVAYASLLITDFRGFNQFGLIGGVGMVLCWLATFAVMPALVSLSERIRPIYEAGRAVARAGPFTRLVAAAVGRRPFVVAGAGLALTAFFAYTSWRFVAGDPFEYDFRNLRSTHSRQSGSYSVSSRVNRIFDYKRDGSGHAPNIGGMVVLADRPDQAPHIVRLLEERRDRAPPHARTIHEIASLASVLPKDQERKLPLIAEIRSLLTGSALKWLTPSQREEVRRNLPPADLRPVAAADVPEPIARAFTEKDGRRGTLVYVSPMDSWDGRVLLRFADRVRDIELGSGERIRSSGSPVIFADMLQAILTDGPKAGIASLAGVVVLLLFAFGLSRAAPLALGAVLLGLLWTVGFLGARHLFPPELAQWGAMAHEVVERLPRINFLNFIALPITIGIGADYAVNLLSRYHQESANGGAAARRVVETTGGAVALCSLTTIIGYGALLVADNQALVSFGWLAMLGELMCLAVILCLLPAVLVLLEARRARLARPAEAAAGGQAGKC